MKDIILTGLRIRYFFAFTFVMVSLLFIAGCKQKTGINVIIVTFDTTRADHIGSYGEKGVYTPNLDKLALDGVVYERALTSIPITLPSHSSIMTGKVPFAHGVRDNGLFNLPQNQQTLAEILKQNSYKTAAAIGSFPLTSQFGINQGFDYFNEHITQKYEDMFGDRTIPKEALFFDERKASQVNDAIMPWIQDNASDPFFAWIHYFDPHHPHEPPAPYNQMFVNDLYQGEIAYSDEIFGNLIQQLKQLGVYDNTLIIFTSDHGEGLEEHNESTHSLLIYNSTLHVPLIIKYPNQQFANTRISNWVGLVDIFPTILDTLNIEIPNDIQGHKLPINVSDNITHEIYAETLSPRFSRGWSEQRGLIKNGYKYIHGSQKELYNIDNDPHEINNLIEKEANIARSMKSDLQEYLDEHRLSEDLESSIHVDADTLNTLRGLGYIQSSGNAVEKFEEKLNDSGDPPQKHVDTISAYSNAKQLLFKSKFIEAIRYLDALLLTDPDNLAYLELKIQAEINIGNIQNAKSMLESLPQESYGTLTPAKRIELLAKIHLFEGDIEKAKTMYLEAEDIEQSASGQYQLAKIFMQQHNYIQQQIHLNNILKIDKSLSKIMGELAVSYSLSGDYSDAEKMFIQLITNDPYNPQSYYNYGVLLTTINDFVSATAQFKKAIELQKNYTASHYALIETLLKMNQVNEAQNAYKLLYKIAPKSQHYILAQKLIAELRNENRKNENRNNEN